MRFIKTLADLPELTTRLHDGDRIRLDATSGLVEILERAEAR